MVGLTNLEKAVVIGGIFLAGTAVGAPQIANAESVDSQDRCATADSFTEDCLVEVLNTDLGSRPRQIDIDILEMKQDSWIRSARQVLRSEGHAAHRDLMNSSAFRQELTEFLQNTKLEPIVQRQGLFLMSDVAILERRDGPVVDSEGYRTLNNP